MTEKNVELKVFQVLFTICIIISAVTSIFLAFEVITHSNYVNHSSLSILITIFAILGIYFINRTTNVRPAINGDSYVKPTIDKTKIIVIMLLIAVAFFALGIIAFKLYGRSIVIP